MNIGAWSIPVSWGFIAIHLVHYVPNELENIPGYSDGRILAWSYGVHHSSTDVYVIGMNDLENPSNFINLSPLSHNIFCSGHTHLPDGRIIIAGGHEDNDIGLKETIRFNVMNNSWMMLSLMGYDRWYPSLTTLADGRILVSGGTFGGSGSNIRDVCEVYNPESNTWTSVVAGNDGLHYYPFMFVLPRAVTMKVNGQPTLFPAGSVFCAGWKQGTRLLGYFSSTSSWVWSDSIDSGKDDDYSSAVMYEPGKILLAGGGGPGGQSATNTARKIDFTSIGQPQWQPAGNMTYGRRNLNLVLLADGKVLAVGGNAGAPPDQWNYVNPVYVPELWNPGNNTWTPMAEMAIPRWYHSAAMLLPDGRVLATGGDYNAGTPNWSGGQNPLNGTKVEFFTPPYLMPQHIGARPVILNYEISLRQGEIPPPNSDSWTWWCGRRYKISLDNASNISKVALVRVASVTHGFDQNQRYVPLNFIVKESENYIIVDAPPNRYHAPPGLYMLFVMRQHTDPNNSEDVQDVPSLAKYVKLTDMNVVDPNPPPE